MPLFQPRCALPVVLIEVTDRGGAGMKGAADGMRHA